MYFVRRSAAPAIPSFWAHLTAITYMSCGYVRFSEPFQREFSISIFLLSANWYSMRDLNSRSHPVLSHVLCYMHLSLLFYPPTHGHYHPTFLFTIRHRPLGIGGGPPRRAAAKPFYRLLLAETPPKHTTKLDDK